MVENKKCSRCNETKSFGEFYKRARAKDGHRSECKTCCNADNKQYATDNPEVVKKCSNSWAKRNPEKRRSIKNNWCQNNKESVKASNDKQQDKRRLLKTRELEDDPRMFYPNGSRIPIKHLIARLFPEPSPTPQEFYAKNRVRRLEDQRRWRDRNRAKLRLRYSQYSKNNRAKVNAKFQAYRAKKLQACVKWANKTAIVAIYEQARELTEATGIPHHVDHIIPLNSNIVQGLHNEFNLTVMVGSENSAKGNRHWPDMP